MIGKSNCTDIFEIIGSWEGGGIFFTASMTNSVPYTLTLYHVGNVSCKIHKTKYSS